MPRMSAAVRRDERLDGRVLSAGHLPPKEGEACVLTVSHARSYERLARGERVADKKRRYPKRHAPRTATEAEGATEENSACEHETEPVRSMGSARAEKLPSTEKGSDIGVIILKSGYAVDSCTRNPRPVGIGHRVAM